MDFEQSTPDQATNSPETESQEPAEATKEDSSEPILIDGKTIDEAEAEIKQADQAKLNKVRAEIGLSIPDQGSSQSVEQEIVDVGSLDEFDQEYFQELEGENGWSAIGQENCTNQRYFTARGTKGEKLGIIGVYDTEEDQNITHTVVDPKFRGQGLAGKLKDQLMSNLGLDSVTLTIDLDNDASIKAAEKLSGVKKVSDEEYEQKYHKVKYIYEKPQDQNE